MRRALIGLSATVAGVLVAASADAQGTIRIGIVLAYSGQFADTAAQMDNAIKLYVKQHGDTVAGKKIEFIRKDVGGIAPPVAKRLSQELVVRDGVDVLAGYILTPNALAGADVSRDAKKFMVVMLGATSIVITRSPYMARTSFTVPQTNETLGEWIYRSGVRKVYTAVSDYAGGHDAEAALHRAFKAAGGEIVGSVRWPVANPDFAPFVQRMKDTNPEALYLWIPGGTQPAALGKALAERGISPQKTKVFGQDVLTDETALKGMGEIALGIITASHYDYNLKNAANQAFVKAYSDAYGRNPDIFSIGGWDGIHLIYEALKKTGGKTDGESLINAAKGMKWDSPRGPMWTDPDTRDVVQTIYIRRVEKVNGKLLNVEFDKVENVKDPVNARPKQ